MNTTKYRPTSMYQQNFGGKRYVQNSAVDTSKLIAGWIRIYRPKARVDVTNKWKVTVVNNTTTKSLSYQIVVGTSVVSTVSLTAANTAGSFRVQTVTTSGTVPAILLSNGQSIYLTTAKGNEIYAPLVIRQLSP